jgi:2,3-bisphosphoglycerate-dependent phosphoglycerate mutase
MAQVAAAIASVDSTPPGYAVPHYDRGMPVEVVYETHSITVDNETGHATGWLPGELSERGREAAVRLGERRREDNLAAVYTSDLRRAVETAEIAFRGSPLRIIQDRRLRECNFGAMNGRPRDEVHARGIDERYPDGETWREAVERVRGFLEELAHTRDEDRVLVIGHMSAWYALECHAKGMPLEDVYGTRMNWQEGWEYRL